MRIPQVLPPRTTDLSTQDARALAAAQPERRREYVQLERGDFRGFLRERLYGTVGLLNESWSCSLRVTCTRSRGYVAFSSLLSQVPATWCGLAMDADAVLEVGHDWEVTSRSALESFSFAVEIGFLEKAEASLAGRDPRTRPAGNRVLRGPGFGSAARALRHYVNKALEGSPQHPEAQQALESDLLHLAAQLRAWGNAGAKPESSSRRRAAVRRIEAYLEAHPHALPSLADLCAIGGVGERTLEYAFRELVGMPPARFLRTRRLNAVRRDLLDGDPESLRITDVAMHWGFWELGRFAAEYRALFGERPSETVAARTRRSPEATLEPR